MLKILISEFKGLLNYFLLDQPYRFFVLSFLCLDLQLPLPDLLLLALQLSDLSVVLHLYLSYFGLILFDHLHLFIVYPPCPFLDLFRFSLQTVQNTFLSILQFSQSPLMCFLHLLCFKVVLGLILLLYFGFHRQLQIPPYSFLF